MTKPGPRSQRATCSLALLAATALLGLSLGGCAAVEAFERERFGDLPEVDESLPYPKLKDVPDAPPPVSSPEENQGLKDDLQKEGEELRRKGPTPPAGG